MGVLRGVRERRRRIARGAWPSGRMCALLVIFVRMVQPTNIHTVYALHLLCCSSGCRGKVGVGVLHRLSAMRAEAAALSDSPVTMRESQAHSGAADGRDDRGEYHSAGVGRVSAQSRMDIVL